MADLKWLLVVLLVWSGLAVTLSAHDDNDKLIVEMEQADTDKKQQPKITTGRRKSLYTNDTGHAKICGKNFFFLCNFAT